MLKIYHRESLSVIESLHGRIGAKSEEQNQRESEARAVSNEAL
jgi:hypothetical protein